MTILGVGQAEFHIADPQRNLEILRDLLEQADRKGVEILTLPELANSGYALAGREEALSTGEPIPGGPVSQLLQAWSAGKRLVVCGLCEVDGEILYNTAAVFAGGNYLATYRKAHLFMREPEIFSPGTKPPPVLEANGWRVGVLICYDWAFPEFARILAMRGAQALLHPSNLVLPYGQSAMRTRSIENRVFTVTANRYGQERGVPFSGCSQITSPTGDLLVQAGAAEQGVFTCEVDLGMADNKLITPFNHVFEDRRPELYHGLSGSEK